MKKYIFLIFLKIVVSLNVYGQNADVSVERAKSLSNMADFYFTAGNYDKAIELEQKSMNMIGELFGYKSFEYATSALTIANYYYSKGRNDSSCPQNVTDQSFSKAINNLKIIMSVTTDSLLTGYDKLNSKDKYLLWQQACPLYDRLFPCYVACLRNDSTVSDLYNTVLFSKGITWRDYNEAIKADWRIIQKNLHSDEIAIEFISPVDLDVDNIIYYALIIRKDHVAPYMIKLFDLMQLRKTLESASSKFEKDIQLGKLIWGNLEKEMQGIRNIYFSATHVLHQMPIEYLPIDNQKYYFEEFNFYRLSSTINLCSERIRPKYYCAALYGGLDYDYSQELESDGERPKKRAGVESLYNTRLEIEEISQILKSKGVKCEEYTGLKGTEASFKSLPEHNINVLHLSTHGKYETTIETSKYINEDNALSRSYIALSGVNMKLLDPQIDENNDGIMSALDISKMIFKSLDLVSLAACESALGGYSDDDGILGLQKGFKKAGAKTILMSLDKVDDEATRILMVEFYKNLMSGKSKLQSLKDAQKHLRHVDNGKYDTPEYWASFIMLDGIN
ncbi:MAG: CHAT domain-containing protein [Prevotella sp.]|nr:CHAT domain-containing protein [Prevotella sp.]